MSHLDCERPRPPALEVHEEPEDVKREDRHLVAQPAAAVEPPEQRINGLMDGNNCATRLKIKICRADGLYSDY